MESDPFCKEIAKKFGEAIASRRLSKAQAARDINVSRQMLYEYLKGNSLPRHEVLQRACVAWGLTLNYKGLLVSVDAFRQPPVDTLKPRSEQLDLKLEEALDQLHDEDIGIRILRKENGRVELQVELRFGN